MQPDSDGGAAVDIGAGYPPTESTAGADLVGSREEALDRIEDLEAEYPGLIEDLASRYDEPVPEYRAPMFSGFGGDGGFGDGPKRNGWFRRLVRFLARLLSELGEAIERALGVDE